MIEQLDGPRIELLDGETCVLTGAWRFSVPCLITIHENLEVYGKATITNYRVVFQPDDENVLMDRRVRRDLFDVPLLLIDKIIRTETRNELSLEIVGKDGRIVKIRFNQAVNSQHSIYKVISAMAFPTLLLMRFCFSHKYDGPVDGWDIYSPLAELERLGVHPGNCSRWTIVDNQEGNICSTYPSHFAVPAGLSNEDIMTCANFRKKERIPALVWVSRNSRATLWRSSQPKVGIINTKSIVDERVLNLIITSSSTFSLLILDARPYLNAQANRTKGGGYEREKHYTNVELRFLNMENIHKVREAFKLMMFQCNSVPASKYLSSVEKSGWLDLLSSILAGSVECIEGLESGRTVLVHCSDGWDRTSQICSVAQLCLDYHFRSIRGFCELIEKDWLSFGHQFETRLGHNPNTAEDKRSPIFIQFLDCVVQLLRQFPVHFEFNERMLLDLVTFSHSCRFGTFVLNSYQERLREKVFLRSPSVWTYILNNVDTYKNPYYREGSEEVITPRSSIRKLVIWQELFNRWESDFFYGVPALNSQRELQETMMKCAVDGVELYKHQLRDKDLQIESLAKELEEVRELLRTKRE